MQQNKGNEGNKGTYYNKYERKRGHESVGRLMHEDGDRDHEQRRRAVLGAQVYEYDAILRADGFKRQKGSTYSCQERVLKI